VDEKIFTVVNDIQEEGLTISVFNLVGSTKRTSQGGRKQWRRREGSGERDGRRRICDRKKMSGDLNDCKQQS